MARTIRVGGAHATFADPIQAAAIADALDHAFGAEGDWEHAEPARFGDLDAEDWARLGDRAEADLGADAVPHLRAVPGLGIGVYLPALIEVVDLPVAGTTLTCASLPRLRDELATLAEHRGLPIDDAGLDAIVAESADHPPEVVAFARVARAANEAVRADCPVWIMADMVPAPAL